MANIMPFGDPPPRQAPYAIPVGQFLDPQMEARIRALEEKVAALYEKFMDKPISLDD
jgi:hypothetical protein